MRQVAVAIILQGDRVLVCQRKKGSRYGLKWEFPGGKLEAGETIEECVRRELHEELSIEVGPVERTEVEVSHYDDGGSFEVTYFYFSSFQGVPVNNVFEQFRWVAGPELAALDILHGNNDVVRRLLSGPLRSSRP